MELQPADGTADHGASEGQALRDQASRDKGRCWARRPTERPLILSQGGDMGSSRVHHFGYTKPPDFVHEVEVGD